jgi:hypothetical protein
VDVVKIKGDKVRILVAQLHALAAFADTTLTHWFAPPLLGLKRQLQLPTRTWLQKSFTP